MNCVFLTSSGVVLIDATTSNNTSSFCRLIACLLQLSHGPEGSNTNTIQTIENTTNTTNNHLQTSMFLLQNRHVHLIEDINLEIAAACWYTSTTTIPEILSTTILPTIPAIPAIPTSTSTSLPIVLNQIFHTFIATHSIQVIQQEVTLANQQLEDLCLSYSIQGVVQDVDVNEDTTATTTTTTSDSQKNMAFQTFTTDYLLPYVNNWSNTNDVEFTQEDTVLFPQPEPPNDPNPKKTTRPLLTSKKVKIVTHATLGKGTLIEVRDTTAVVVFDCDAGGRRVVVSGLKLAEFVNAEKETVQQIVAVGSGAKAVSALLTN